MKVLHICEDFITGGIESFLVDLSRAMQPKIVSKLAFLYGQDSYGLGDEVMNTQRPFETVAIGMARRLRVDPAGITRLSRIIRSYGPDVLHCHSYYSVLSAILTRPFTGRLPIVYTVHATFRPGKQRSDFIVHAMTRACDAVISVSRNSARGILALTSGKVDPLVILNGIDPKRVRPAAGFRRDEFRRQLGIPVDSLVLLNVAALTPNKDQASLINALPVVSERFPGVVLLVAGTGPEETNLRALIDKLGLASCVRLLGVRNDVAELLAAADLFVLSSRSEGMAISILEACLAGIPVVCTAVGGAQELVKAGLDLALIPQGNQSALSAEVIRIADRKSSQEDKRARAHEMFSIERTAARYVSVYRQVQGVRSEAGVMRQKWI